MILLLALLLAQADSRVKLCDKADAKKCATVNASGQVSISGTISASTTGRATAASPSYTEGTDNPLSIDLSGNIRTLATAQTAAKATAADPSYTEGTTNPISQDLSGHLRTNASLPAGAATSAKQDTGNTSLASIDGKDFATQTTLALIKAKTDNLDVALSTRTKPADTQNVAGTFWPTTAGAPSSCRLSDGSAFYDGAKTGQLPAALDGSGFLKVHEQGTATVDPSDRAARLLGVVYGSRGQQLVQTATNFNLQAEIAVGSTLIDPRSIRTLTSGDTVTTAPPADATTNVTKFGGTNVSTGTGAGGSGIPRVTVSNDSNVLATQSGTWNTSPDATVTGSGGALGALNNAVTISNQGVGWSEVSIQLLTGTSPVMTVTFESSIDGTIFNARVCRQTDLTGTLATTTTTFPSEWRCNGAGMATFRVRVSSYTSGSTTANLRASTGVGPVFLNAPLPAGANLIGSVGIDQTTPGTTNAVALTQIGSTTVLTGGTAGSLGVGGLVADGSAASGNPVLVAGKGFNGIAQAVRLNCDKRIAFTTLATTATVQQIALVAGQTIYVCGWYALISTATTAVNIKWVTGTGTNCATGVTDVTPLIFTTPTAAPAISNWNQAPMTGPPVAFSASASALCITQSSATNSTTLSGVIYYTQN